MIGAGVNNVSNNSRSPDNLKSGGPLEGYSERYLAGFEEASRGIEANGDAKDLARRLKEREQNCADGPDVCDDYDLGAIDAYRTKMGGGSTTAQLAKRFASDFADLVWNISDKSGSGSGSGGGLETIPRYIGGDPQDSGAYNDDSDGGIRNHFAIVNGKDMGGGIKKGDAAAPDTAKPASPAVQEMEFPPRSSRNNPQE